jgi:gamma-glutamylcysteine synthetase
MDSFSIGYGTQYPEVNQRRMMSGIPYLSASVEIRLLTPQPVPELEAAVFYWVGLPLLGTVWSAYVNEQQDE